MNWQLFISTFALIFVAELPDKTALATLMMATRGSPWPIFVGVALAFVVQTLVAVTFGKVIGTFPENWVHLAAGMLFILFAVMAWIRKEEDEEKTDEALIEKTGGGLGTFFRAAWSSFLVIFIAEWGDLTQLASVSLEARFHDPLTIFSASVLALWSVTAIAILIGNKAKKVIHPQLLNKIAAFAFVGVGIYLLAGWFTGRA